MSQEELNEIKSSPKPRKSKHPKTRFYEKVLDNADLKDFETASSLDGIDDEIALLRVKIKFIMEKEPQNIKLIMQIADLLAKLLRVQQLLHKSDKKGIKEALGNVIRDIAVPLGVAVISKK
jgi:hypothetical protein